MNSNFVIEPTHSYYNGLTENKGKVIAVFPTEGVATEIVLEEYKDFRKVIKKYGRGETLKTPKREYEITETVLLCTEAFIESKGTVDKELTSIRVYVEGSETVGNIVISI